MVQILPKLSNKRILRVIDGSDSSIPKLKAIQFLLESDIPEKHILLKDVLENFGLDALTRFTAAVSLGKLHSSDARKILEDNLDINSDQILTGVIMGLANCGDENSLNAITASLNKLPTMANALGIFACAVISCRLELNGNELQQVKRKDFLKIPKRSERIVTSQPNSKEIELCLRHVDNEFGVRLSKKFVWQLDYFRNKMLVLLNKNLESHDLFQELCEKNTILGLAAKKDVTNDYFLSYLILTFPKRETRGFNIYVTNHNGKICFAGGAVSQKGINKFSISSLALTGVHPLLLEGTIIDENIDIKTAKYSSRVPLKTKLIELREEEDEI